MASINQSIRIVCTQGQDVIDKTSYISGDMKTIKSEPIFGSGLQSGVGQGGTLNLTLNNLKSLTFTNNLPSGMLNVTFFSQSGSVTFNAPAGQPVVWWSGNGFSNPLATASGDITGVSVQNASGYATSISGLYNFDLQAIYAG